MEHTTRSCGLLLACQLLGAHVVMWSRHSISHSHTVDTDMSSQCRSAASLCENPCGPGHRTFRSRSRLIPAGRAGGEASMARTMVSYSTKLVVKVLSLLGFRTRRYGGDAHLKQRLDLFRAKVTLPQTTIRLRHPEWSQRNAHLVGGGSG